MLSETYEASLAAFRSFDFEVPFCSVYGFVIIDLTIGAITCTHEKLLVVLYLLALISTNF